ncbi:hypothetical protein QEN19_003853 [Hanseniaspora menglaensis]
MKVFNLTILLSYFYLGIQNSFVSAVQNEQETNNLLKFESLKIWNSYIKILPVINSMSMRNNALNKQAITNEIIQLISSEIPEENNGASENRNMQVYRRLYDDAPIVANMFRLYYNLPLPPILNKSPFKESHFVLNGEKHSLDEIYYLKTDQLKTGVQYITKTEQPIIKIEPANEQETLTNPLIELHCEVDDDFFEVFIMEAIDGKFDIVWFDTSNLSSSLHELQSNYYDNSLFEVKYDNGEESLFNGSKLMSDHSYTDKQKNNKKGFLNNLDVFLSLQAINQHQEDTWASMNFIKNDANDLVLKANQQEKLRAFNLNKTEILLQKASFEKELLDLKQNGISYENLGLYINGIPVQQSFASKYSLLDTILEELVTFEGLKNAIKGVFPHLQYVSTESIKEIILEYGIMAQKLNMFSQPRKFDILKQEPTKECVLFVNDLETDQQYASLNDDLTVFLETPHDKDFPEMKENWNDVVFILDLEDKEMVNDFIRVLSVISNGFPQRIGFIPKTDDLEMLNKLLQVYNNPVSLQNLLLDHQSLSVNEDLINKSKTLKADIDSMMTKMNIENYEGLIVNGEIFPFRSNTWNYYISNVFSKDIQLIKSYLQAMINNGEFLDHEETKLRDILHSETFPFIERDLTMTPDYFGDAMITRTNYDFILNLRKSGCVFEFSKNNDYEIIHVLTLVGDFSNIEEWRNVYNLMGNNLYGMKIRLITTTDPKNKSWLKFQELLTGETKFLGEYIKKHEKNIHIGKSNQQTIDFSNWLLDLSHAQLQSTRFAVLNGRFLNLENMSLNISSQLWFNFIKYESFKTLQGITALNIALQFQEQDMIPIQTMEDVISHLSFYSHRDLSQGRETQKQGIVYTAETVQVRQPINKILSYIKAEKNYKLFLGSKNFQKESVSKPIDITLVIDPIEERTTKLIEAVSFLKPLKKIINLQILLLPTMDLTLFPRQTYYAKGRDLKALTFEEKNNFEIVRVPDIQLLEAHQSDYTEPIIVSEAFVQKKLQILQGTSRTVVEADINNVCIKVVAANDEEEEITRFNSMSTFGYSMFKISANETRLLKFVSCDPRYEVIEFSLDINSDFSEWKTFKVSDLLSRKALIHVEETDFIEPIAIKACLSVAAIISSRSDFERMSLIFQNTDNDYYILNSKGSGVSKAEIKDNISKEFKAQVINAEWASWMRPTNLIRNQLNYAKFVLIDTLLPLSVDKLLFLDLSTEECVDWLKIAENNNIESVIHKEISSEFTIGLLAYPENEDSYWKNEVYWTEFMTKNKLTHFFKTKNYIMSLKNFRKKNIGDLLRVHYQRLTTDINSLKQYEEALINNVQSQMNITAININHIENNNNYSASEIEFDEL